MALCLPHGPALTTIRDLWEYHSLDYMHLCWQGDVFTFQHRFVLAFLPRSNRLLISWLQSPSTHFIIIKKVKSNVNINKDRPSQDYLSKKLVYK